MIKLNKPKMQRLRYFCKYNAICNSPFKKRDEIPSLMI